ncbi:hypothetical protein H6F76_03095 [Leptolyngbya sp. FACHB-321]|uniref:hypothetical protein n=1 Tax=Leptolyngbya sp. FACHB-321 TaxID=2692807 RepID=UPI001685DA4E|nr:hypothetical protein [Leptolyngbya sp. FACHB-321]MBD2034037.1 hypothetical protein [Leptolyngbya sp. FACHB-321]
MTVNDSKIQSLLFLAAGCLMFGSTIAGCAATQQQSEAITSPLATTAASPAPSTSPSAPRIPGVQQWTAILKGESAHGLTFSNDGKLLDQEKPLLTGIPVSYVSDGNVTDAQRLFVSDPSPSGRFNVVKACEGTTEASGLCWAVFLVDRQAKTAAKISIAKYGGQNWVQWSGDERYAVFTEAMEGVSWFIVLDLQTRETKLFEQTSAVADLSSFRWLDNRTFQANISCDDRSDCTAAPFRGDITALFTK